MAKSHEWVLMGKITTPHGIRGAVKIHFFCENYQSLNGTLSDQNEKTYTIQVLRPLSQSTVVATVKGVENRNQAELLRNVELYVPRSSLPELEEEEFYYHDLIGLEVLDEQGNTYGHAIQMYNFGAGEILEIKGPDEALYTLPFKKEAAPTISLEKKHIIIVPSFLLKAQ